MEVKVMSREIVKPSSPTADHLKTFKLSHIDQLSPRLYTPFLLFYQRQSPEEENSRRCQLLKLSLSRLLTFFYPFAGTIIDDPLSVLCDDQGVPFTLANANFPLVDFLRQPDCRRLPDFFPDQLEKDPSRCPHLVGVQVTHFSCGGFVLYVAVSHLVADASSISFFLKSWAAVHGDVEFNWSLPKPPIFNASSLFPPAPADKAIDPELSIMEPFMKQVKVCKRRLVYGPAAVRALKEKAASLSVPNPTRVQVVSAHLAKCIMSLLKGKSKGIGVSHTVNLRPKAEPHFPEELIGNLVAVAVVPWVDVDESEAHLVKQIRDATAKIDGDLIKRMRCGEAYPVLHEIKRNFSAGTPPGFTHDDLIFFTSMCNMGWYDVDFDSGKPVFVASGIGPPIGSTTKQLMFVCLMDTRSRDGVEAYLVLDEQLVAALEWSHELLAYATFDQNPLHQD